MAAKSLDLLNIFKAVSGNLVENQSALNEADTYNHDHGDHMVEIFKVITQAMEEKKGADPADQLEYAGNLLRKKSKSGSADLYANGLAKAAKQFVGQQVTSDNAMQLVQTLMGGGQKVQAPPAASGDMLGSLLSGLAGGKQKSDAGFDASDLLTAGMAFLQSKQEGDSNLEALVDAAVASTQMGASSHRSQSGKLVANTILQMMSGMGS